MRPLNVLLGASLYLALAGSIAGAATRCQITFTTCANYPTLSNQVIYDSFDHADSNDPECMVRASDYYQWCGSSGVTTATYYDNDTPTDSKRAGQSSSCPPNWVCPSAPIYTSQVGIWYELWWEPRGTTPEDPWQQSRYKPLLGYYGSNDTSVIQTHLTQLKAAGIDFLVFDDTNGISANEGTVDVNARAIIAVDDKLAPSRQIPYSFAIGAQLWANRSVSGQAGEANYVDYFAADPLYYRWQAKPLLVNYNAYDSAAVFDPLWDDSRFSVRRATGDVDVANPNLAPYGALGYWGWLTRFPQAADSEEIGVSPGGDNVHRNCSGCTIHVDRQNGKLFELEWLNAIEKNPRAIMVAGWNEFGDETAIEPAQAVSGPPWVDSYGSETPDLYLQIASAYGNLRKGLMDGAFYQDADGLSVYAVVSGRLQYQASLPHGHPVIPLPAGTLRGLLGPNAFAPVPADGTLLTAPGLPPSVMVDGKQVLFQSLPTAQIFATATRTLTTEDFLLIPSLGTINSAAPVYGTSGYPPAFLTDHWNLMPTNCLRAITANGSSITTIPASQYGAYANVATLLCN